jgi:hypothetical protein
MPQDLADMATVYRILGRVALTAEAGAFTTEKLAPSRPKQKRP